MKNIDFYCPSYRTKLEWKEVYSEMELEGDNPPLSSNHRQFRFMDYSIGYTDSKVLVQVLLARVSCHRNHWGNSHVIIELPKKLTYEKNNKLFFGSSAENRTFTVEQGGVGFARLIGQIWADQIGIEYCHIWDDNVVKTFELNSKFEHQVVPFERVWKQMEAILTMDIEELNADSPDDAKINMELKHYAGIDKIDNWSSSIGAIGMGRVGERIRTKVFPFKNTLLYSAILLNVKDTVKNGVLFPCKRIWEGKITSLIFRY